MLYVYDGANASLTFGGKLDVPKQAASKDISARERFKNLDRRASETQSTDKDLNTLHKNSIRSEGTSVQILRRENLEGA